MIHPCHDCGVGTVYIHEFYGVLDDVWAEATTARVRFLCIGCLERRLGRILSPVDFKDVHRNGDYSERLAARLGPYCYEVIPKGRRRVGLRVELGSGLPGLPRVFRLRRLQQGEMKMLLSAQQEWYDEVTGWEIWRTTDGRSLMTRDRRDFADPGRRIAP